MKIKLWQNGFRFAALALGALHAWAAIQSASMNPDGISYLDMGDAFWQGEWRTAINPIWSPLYGWILGLAMAIVKPEISLEFTVVHLVNFSIYLVALLCFEFFWRELDSYRTHLASANSMRAEESETAWGLPAWAWIGLGYSIFIWSALSLIAIWAVTPDMLMACFALLAAGCVIRLRWQPDRPRIYIWFGALLGLAFLTKAVMLPLGLAFFAIVALGHGSWREKVRGLLPAFLVFIVIISPFLLTLAYFEGRFSFGDVGELTYVRYVNGIKYPHWQGDNTRNGKPIHPSRQILSHPPIYEFSGPIGGSYPISQNPYYWYEGVVRRFNWGQQLNRLLISSIFYFDIFFEKQAILILGSIVLYAASGTSRSLNFFDLFRRWGIALIALAALALYAPIYVEGRYIGVFVMLLWGDVWANLSRNKSKYAGNLNRIVSIVMLLFLWLNIIIFNLEGAFALSKPNGAPQRAAAPASNLLIAETLLELGAPPDASVGVIGYGFESFWARLANVRIVVEMLEWEAAPFWYGDSNIQADVIDAFQRGGAIAIVAEDAPPYARLDGWRQVGESSSFIYLFGP